METHVQIIEDVVAELLKAIDYLDRSKVTMVNAYPDWDDTDTAEVKTLSLAKLAQAITKLEAL